MSQAELARKVLEKYPKAKSKKELARLLMEEYPKDFKNLEHARSAIRYATGARGNRDRGSLKDPNLTKFFYNGFEKWATENLNTDYEPWGEPFTIPISIKHLNIIADIHSVYLDHRVLLKFLRETKNKEALMINGDLVDSGSLTRHMKTHNVVEYEKELEICHNLLKGLKEEFTHVYLKFGNHDYWLERYLLINAREVFRVRGLQLGELLRLGELGVHEIHNLRYWTHGDLEGLHGHEFPGYGMGKFPATGLLDKWQRFRKKVDVKVIGSHCHKNDISISKKSIEGKFGMAWITPAMCRLSPHYNPYGAFDQGWATSTLNNDGQSEVNTFVV